MAIQAQIDALEALETLDLELAELVAELNREKQELAGKQQRLEELEARLGHTTDSIRQMESTRAELLAETRQMSAQLDKSRERLARCRNEREANAAQREVEELRKLYRDREIEIEKLQALVAQAGTEVEELTVKRDELRGALGASEGDVASRLGELEGRVEAKNVARDAAAKAVKPVLYRRYEMIRKQRGHAVAHTLAGTCSACHMQIPPMMFQQLRRGDDFGACPSCNRILYFKAPPSADASGKEAD